MEYNDIVSKIIKGENIYNLPLRVCFYARVSTDSDTQLNSLENQLNYYENYIKSNVNWIYVDGYIDEGKSGVRVEKRFAFLKMIRDAKLHKFDLIITKEVSRFARDLEDSIHYIRELKNSGVGVFFENQNLNTFDSNSELILNIMFNIAQDESRKLSNRIKFGHKEAMKKGHVLGSSNIIGYKKDKCKLVIIEDEAKFIRKIFELYATGNYGLYKLSKALGELGFYNKNNNLYDKDTLKRIISNPKYKGYYRGHLYEIIDYRTKKRKKINVSDQIIYKADDNIIPAIVSEELWNRANDVLNTRTKSYIIKSYSGGLKYPLSSKMFCECHNTSYQRSHGKKGKNRPTWSCSLYLHSNLDGCISPIIPEIDLYFILKNIFNDILPNKEILIKDLIDLYKNVNCYDYDKKLNDINKELEDIENKKKIVLDLIFKGIILEEDVKEQFINYKKEIDILLKQKEEIINNKNFNIYDNFSVEIDNILNKDCLDCFIRKFIDEIIISKVNNNRYNIKLDIYLDLSGSEKIKTKGSKYINKVSNDYKIYLSNQIENSLESKRICDYKNKYIYNVFIKL